MSDLLAGSKLRALDTPATQVSVQGDGYTATSATYTTTATSGTYADCAVVFVAPTTGRVKISVAGRLTNDASTTGTLIAPETKTGATIGSGAVVEAATDGSGPSHYGSTFCRVGVSHVLSGLTPGSTYNTRLLHRISSGTTATASIALRELIVEPLT